MPRTLLLLAAALSAAALLLAGPERCRGAGPSAAEKKIEEALMSPTQMDFVETPLQDVVDYLKDLHQIEIQVDRKALDDVGLDPSTLPMRKNLKGISLRSALRLTLRDHELTYLIRDEVLLITTPKDAASRLTTKVYRVDDLVGSGKMPGPQPARCEMLIHVITSTVAPDSWANAPAAWGGGMGGFGMGGYAPGRYDGPGMGGGPAAAPPKKAEPGPKGSIAGASFGGVPMLVVSQSYHVHGQITALLEELRRVAGAKRPTPAKGDKKPAPAPAAKPPAKKPAGTPPARRLPEPPTADPFGDAPAVRPPAEGSASGSEDPFGT